jgi:hypothetical protein
MIPWMSAMADDVVMEPVDTTAEVVQTTKTSMPAVQQARQMNSDLDALLARLREIQAQASTCTCAKDVTESIPIESPCPASCATTAPPVSPTSPTPSPSPSPATHPSRQTVEP